MLQLFVFVHGVLASSNSDLDEETSLLTTRTKFQLAKVSQGVVVNDTGNSYTYSQVNTDVKCRLNHKDRLFRYPARGSNKNLKLEQCFTKCKETDGCIFFSYGSHAGGKVCMGCKGGTYTEHKIFDTHAGFKLYQYDQRVFNEIKAGHLKSVGQKFAKLGSHRVYNVYRVCLGAHSDDWKQALAKGAVEAEAELNFAESFCFTRLRITYLSGHVSCRNRASGRSFFGCDEDSLGLHLAKLGDNGKYDFAFPRDDRTNKTNKDYNEQKIYGYKSMNKGHAPWYKLNQYNPRDEIMELRQAGKTTKYHLHGQYKLVYNEVLTGGTEGDNSGVACYHLKFWMCDDQKNPVF